MTYQPFGPFVDVPPAQASNPPAGAKALSAAALNRMEAGISDAVAKGDLVVSVKDYGAVGNGVNADLPGMQAAFDAAAGGTLLIPAGTYLVSNSLVIPANTTIIAYGATVRITGQTGILRNYAPTDSFAGYTGHGNITILGGTWDGNAAGGGGGVVTSLTNIATFTHAANITIRDATFTNTCSAHAVELGGIDGARIINCRFLGFIDTTTDLHRQMSEAIQLDLTATGSSVIGAFDNTPTRNVLVQGCYCGPSDRLGPYGRFVGSHAAASGKYFDNIQVLDNRVAGTIREGIHAYAWRSSIIAGNQISGTGTTGITVTTPDPAGGFTAPVDSVLVADNIVTDSGATAGIRALGYATAQLTDVTIRGNTVRNSVGAGIATDYCPNAAVTGNTVRTTTASGLSVQTSDGALVSGNTVNAAGTIGIGAFAGDGVQVVGNSVDTTGSHGINVSPGTNTAIQSNRIRKAGAVGIRMSAGSTGVLVADNQVRKGTGTTTQGVSFDATATGGIVVGNDLSGNGWAAATAISLGGAAPRTDYAGGVAIPGHNLI